MKSCGNFRRGHKSGELFKFTVRDWELEKYLPPPPPRKQEKEGSSEANSGSMQPYGRYMKML